METEMNVFSGSHLKTREHSEGSPSPLTPTGQDDDHIVSIWAWAASTILSTTAIPLILFPRILLFVSESGSAERRTTLTPLESFLALHLGILLAALSLALIFNIPQSSVVPSSEHKAHGHPLLQPLTGACALMGFISYNTHSVGTFSFLMFLGTATISIWGLWVILFEGSSRISRRTGADKHTSRFIFGNQTAASTQKKRWKEQQAKAKAH